MSRAEDYVEVDSLSEVYELCQRRSSLVVGGMVWLKMISVTKCTIVDLSGLGPDKIEEAKEELRIGATYTLRQLETGQGLDQYFGGVFKECVRHIVGVQTCNLATAGGNIYSHFGFSDILICLMALDTYVELYHGGIVPLEEFAKWPVCRDDRDILVCIIIKKDGREAVYTTQKNSEMDFPVIACRVSRWGSDWCAAVGARPGWAQVVKIRDDGYNSLARLAGKATDSFICGSNMRASEQYRRQLAAVYTRRLMERLTGRSVSKGRIQSFG